MAAFDISAMSARTPEEASGVNDLIFKTLREDPRLTELYSVITGIEFDKRIPIIGLLSDIMEKKAGDCAFPEGGIIDIIEKTWTPGTAVQEQRLCKDTTETKFQFWQNNSSDLLERYDLTNSGEMNYLIAQVVEGMARAILRIADFSDTAAALVSGAGKITTALGASGVARMNIIDGIWTQAFVSEAAGDTPLVPIAENALGSYAAQLALASDTAKNVFTAMILQGKDEVRNASNSRIMCTRTLFDNYFVWLTENGFDTALSVEEKAYRVIKLKAYGVEIVERPDWDATIQTYFDNGTTYDLPHRAMFVSKDNLLIGTPSQKALESFSSHYSQDLAKVIVREEIRLDAKIALDEGLVVAY